MSAQIDRLQEIKEKCGALLVAAGDTFSHVDEYTRLCEEFISLGGSKDDTIIRVAERMFGFYTKDGENDRSQQGPWDTMELAPVEGSTRLDFDYLETFMQDCFKSIGVPEKEALISANVLIEADKRGIDSHGKSLYGEFICCIIPGIVLNKFY